MNRNLVAYLRLVLGIPAVLTSSAALAQLQPESHIGTRIPTKPEQLAADKAAKVLAAFATCVVGKQRALASQFILDRTTLNFDKKYKRLADGNCLFAQVRNRQFGDILSRRQIAQLRLEFARP